MAGTTDYQLTAHSTSSPHIKLSNFVKLPVTKRDIYDVCGSVNGLICFVTYGTTAIVHIWNPTLGALLSLPPLPIPSKYSETHFRFGYDPKTDDYKVVKLTCRLAGNFVWVEKWHQTKVYSMRHGYWKSIKQRFPAHVTSICLQNEVCVDGHNGHIHWLCSIGKPERLKSIIGFDLSMETFNEISLPDSIQNEVGFTDVHVLGFTTGKLCVTSCIRGGECEVWVMNEYGVAESWVKRQVFSKQYDIHNPVGFTLKNDFIFAAGFQDSLALYDAVTCKVKPFMMRIPIGGHAKTVPYIDSLVWVAAAKHGRKGSRRRKTSY